jgi:hypothetical protein
MRTRSGGAGRLDGVRTIDTSIVIDSPPAAVWEILVDFAAYEQWNPFIPPGRRLEWHGVLRVPALFAARHEFVLEPVDGGTRLLHREVFTGLLVVFLRRTLRRTEAGFTALNRALKERVEGPRA